MRSEESYGAKPDLGLMLRALKDKVIRVKGKIIFPTIKQEEGILYDDYEEDTAQVIALLDVIDSRTDHDKWKLM